MVNSSFPVAEQQQAYYHDTRATAAAVRLSNATRTARRHGIMRSDRTG